ncbi:MAG: hypothetical protein CK529_14040 [Rhodospirillaceae bacterium]|nr:MAG: hypothetical protein CK529_14040 [Rhodospirillaceae bacterium]
MMRLQAQVGQLLLTPYETKAARDLYAVRFHPTVRKFMTNPSLIAYRAHKDWVHQNLVQAPDMHLWLVRFGAAPRAIGFTQLKLNAAGNAAEIGVMFREPKKHQLAAVLSSAITLHLAFVHFSCAWVTSYVVPTAQHAIDYNLGGGFSIHPSDRPEMVCLRLSRDVYPSSAINRIVKVRIIPSLQISAVTTED